MTTSDIFWNAIKIAVAALFAYNLGVMDYVSNGSYLHAMIVVVVLFGAIVVFSGYKQMAQTYFIGTVILMLCYATKSDDYFLVSWLFAIVVQGVVFGSMLHEQNEEKMQSIWSKNFSEVSEIRRKYEPGYNDEVMKMADEMYEEMNGRRGEHDRDE